MSGQGWMTVAWVAAFAFSACGETVEECTTCNGGAVASGTLEGSYCEDVEMKFCEVRVKRQNKTGTTGYYLKIEWYTPAAMGSGEKTLQLQFDASNVVIEPNVEIDFLAQQGSISRLLSDAPTNLTGEVTPAMTRLKFDSANLEIGAPVSGQLNTLFTRSGRTLTGTFNNVILDGNLPTSQ